MTRVCVVRNVVVKILPGTTVMRQLEHESRCPQSANRPNPGLPCAHPSDAMSTFYIHLTLGAGTAGRGEKS